MTNPLGPKDKDDNLDRTKPAEKDAEAESRLSFSDLLPMNRHDLKAAPGDKSPAEKSPTTFRLTSNLSGQNRFQTSFEYGQWQKPVFELRKSDFTHAIEKPEAELRPLVDK